VAVELGLMSRLQLEQLLALQSGRKPPLLAILIRHGALSAAQADEELAAYRRDMERRNVVVTRRIVGRPHTPRPTPTVEHARDHADYYAMMI
jgi:hypothetical protein